MHNLSARLEQLPHARYVDVIAQLRKEAGVTRPTFIRYCNGGRELPISVAQKWAAVLGISLDNLMNPEFPLK